MDNKCLPALPRIAGSVPFHAAAGTSIPMASKVNRLRRDEVLVLEKKSFAKRIQVTRGILWLTGTPANGDVLLEIGQSFDLENHWPYVLQALEPSEVFIA